MNAKTKERFSIKNLIAIKSIYDTEIVVSFTLLRFIATCLITNTHYNDVYPIRALAVGGLLGDVLFFIVSGFVLSRRTEDSFIKWYWKRIVRIYPAIFFGGIIYLASGYVTMDDQTWFSAFIFPTFFVFTAAIILCYIPLYFVGKIEKKRPYILVTMVVVILWLLVYVFLLDKSTYEMNNTWNLLMICFPYFLGMLFGGYLRKFGLKKRNKINILFYWLAALAFCSIYFWANNKVRGNEKLYDIQIIVPITLLIGLVFFVCAIFSMEKSIKTWPRWILNTINFVASLTLEIYVVQKPIIKEFSEIMFPLNWLLITFMIVVAAVILRIVINFLLEIIRIVFLRIKGRHKYEA